MLKITGISKSFSGVHALKNVSIEFNAGEIHALCGENGAGKSTLMNIIVGNISPDSGALYWKGRLVETQNIQQAYRQGISIVYQEKSLIDSLSVAENIFPANQPKTRLGLIDFTELYGITQALLDRLKLKNISPKTIVSKLSAAQKQMIEIAKALAAEPGLIILDEPTASITQLETETLFDIIRQLKADGVAIIYISHRMHEILAIADVVSVLKDGAYQGTIEVKKATTKQIIKMMVGRDLVVSNYQNDANDKIRFEARNITGKFFQNISFKIHEGEILGFAGILGAGRTEMAMAIFGDTALENGKLFKNGRGVSFKDPSEAVRDGVAYIPDERKSLGLFLDRTISENITAANLHQGWYDKTKIDKNGQFYCHELGIRTPSEKQAVKKLSGGNQQKVVLAKWLSGNPDLLIVNEPTHGVDVKAKADIYHLLKKLTREGKSILLISSELPELLLLSDRIAVMYGGSLQGILTRDEASEEKIAALASGITPK